MFPRNCTGESIFLPLPVYGGCPHSVAYGTLPATAGQVILSLCDCLLPLSSPYKDLVITLGLGQSRIISLYFKVNLNFVCNLNSLLQYNLTYSQIWDWEVDIFEGHYSAFHKPLDQLEDIPLKNESTRACFMTL